MLNRAPIIPNVTFAIVAEIVDDPGSAGGKAEVEFVGGFCGIMVSSTTRLLSKVCHRVMMYI